MKHTVDLVNWANLSDQGTTWSSQKNVKSLLWLFCFFTSLWLFCFFTKHYQTILNLLL